ncbi:MAG: hypothetical protein C0412_09770, partial [Flavobacterium sp.]|nr:hypothetical protein [Flavobacterium sp.]
IKIILDMRISQLSEIEISFYAEFIWHDSLGYRFYDCSFSPIWTGTFSNSSSSPTSGLSS